MMNIIQDEAITCKTDCLLGLLIMEGIQNADPDGKLTAIKHELELSLKNKYGSATRNELKSLHPIDVYVSYYKKFGYTYHVLPQFESVIKGKEIPTVLPLVEVMFIFELKNMLLTAGHDLDQIKAPIKMTVADGSESYQSLSGKNAAAVSGDITISDNDSIISSILRGPDLRTAITEKTNRVLYTVYAPSGVEKQLVFQHLDDIEKNIITFSEKAVTSLKCVN